MEVYVGCRCIHFMFDVGYVYMEIEKKGNI